MTRLRWKIHYTDGSTFSDSDGPPVEAPAFGVLIIAQEDETVGRYLEHGEHQYVWSGAQWFGANDSGLVQYLAKGPCVVRFGTRVKNSTWAKIWEAAVTDPYLPPKAGYHSLERKP